MGGFIDVERERRRISEFLREQVGDGSVVLGLSGGIDSDVVARLAVLALGAARVRAFCVREAGMAPAHHAQAVATARELGLALRELELAAAAEILLAELCRAEPHDGFERGGLLDRGKAQNALRAWVYAMYAERGHTTLGTANRTEVLTGFYLPLGDGLGHVLPIAHLYKTEVRALAEHLGSARAVIEQQPSAGYWPEQTDREDLAYWLLNEAPVQRELRPSPDDVATVRAIAAELTFDRLDVALDMLSGGTDEAVAGASGLEASTVRRLRALVRAAAVVKGRPLHVALPRSANP